jgi:hypothetical protein
LGNWQLDKVRDTFPYNPQFPLSFKSLYNVSHLLSKPFYTFYLFISTGVYLPTGTVSSPDYMAFSDRTINE